MAGTSVVVDLLLRGRDAASDVIGRVRDGIAGVGNAVSAALEPLRSFGVLIGAAIGVGGAKELIDRADAYTRLSNQVRVAASSEQDYHESITDVAAVAQRANSDLDSTASLYGKVKQSADSLGISQQQVADVTEATAKGMQLSGAETAAAAAATGQFTQALASGVFRGDEFNSVMEASPALIKAIADGLGVAVGDMRAMAEAGQLTSDRVVMALLSQKQAIDETYGKLPQTVGQALGQLNNAATLFVGRLNEQTGATQTLGGGLKFLAGNMDAVASVMGAAFAASVAKGAQSMAQFVAASIAARDASRQQAIAAEQQQAANLAAAQGQVAAAQAAYNRALAEQRATAAQLAALESLAGLFASEEALAAARAQATAAANAASAATQRYAAAQAALTAVQAPAAAGVGLVGRALGFLSGPGGLILTAVSALGLLYAAFSKQKPATDELTQSIDSYAAALEKLNQAQLEAASVRIGEAIRDQTQAVADAAAEVERLKSGHVGLWEALTETKARAQLLTEAQGALADASAKLADLEAKREILLRQSADAQQQNAASNLAQVTAYNQQITALERLASNLGDREKYLKQVNDAEIKQTQALLDQAIASGKLAEADRLTLQLAAQKATAAEQAATLARAEALAEEAKVAAMERVQDLQGSLTKTQQEALATARESAAVARAEASAAQAVADSLKQQAEQAGQSNRVMAETARRASETVSATEGLVRAQADGLRSEIDLARAKGDTATAQRLTRDLALLEADGAVKVAKAKEAEQNAEYALAVAKRNQVAALVEKNLATKEDLALAELTVQKELAEAEAAGQTTEALKKLADQLRALNGVRLGAGDGTQQNTQATQQNTQATDENTAAQQVNIKHTNDTSAAVKGLADLMADAKKETEGLSEQTLALFDAYVTGIAAAHGMADSVTAASDAQVALQKALAGGTNEALAEYQRKLSESKTAVRQFREELLFAGNGIQAMEKTILQAKESAKAAFYEQAIQAEQLADSIHGMAERGRIDLGTLQQAVQGATGGFSLLDKQDLDHLRSEIDAANDRLKQMQDEATSAKDRLAELNAEIAREKGDDATAKKLQLELEQRQALAEVEANLAKARLEQNQELVRLYEEQQRKLQTLYDLKSRNLEQERQQTAQTGQANAGTPTGSGSSGVTTGAAAGKTYTLNLVAPGGKTLPATTSTDPSAFLDELERTKLRSLA